MINAVIEPKQKQIGNKKIITAWQDVLEGTLVCVPRLVFSLSLTHFVWLTDMAQFQSIYMKTKDLCTFIHQQKYK